MLSRTPNFFLDWVSFSHLPRFLSIEFLSSYCTQLDTTYAATAPVGAIPLPMV
jgi:hypothetical protein